MTRTYSHNAIKTFQRCAKKWEYSYIDKIIPKEPSIAMERGHTLHGLLELQYQSPPFPLPVGTSQEDTDLLRRYFAKWGAEDDNWTILHIEEEFTFTVGVYSVKFIPDLVIEINGEVWIVDHKTTATIPDEWDPYNMTDFQHLLYVAGLRALGYNVKGFLFNYIRTKPPSQPKLIKDGSRIADVRRVDTDYGTLKGFAEEHDMMGDMDVIARLSILNNTADKFFQRHYLLVNDHAVKQMLDDVEGVLLNMEDAEALSTYPRHVIGNHGGSQACARCPYQTICHADLLGMNTDIVLLDYIEKPKRGTT